MTSYASTQMDESNEVIDFEEVVKLQTPVIHCDDSVHADPLARRGMHVPVSSVLARRLPCRAACSGYVLNQHLVRFGTDFMQLLHEICGQSHQAPNLHLFFMIWDVPFFSAHVHFAPISPYSIDIHC